MEAYYLYFLILGITAVFCSGGGKYERTICAILFAVATWLLIGLRDISVGVDTENYISKFTHLTTLDFNESWNYSNSFSEPLYFLITWLISRISDSYSIYLLGWATFPALAIYIMIRNNLRSTTQFYESILIMCMLGLLAFFVAGIRQTAAISLAMISYEFLKKSQFWKFAIIIAAAYLIHNSVILFLIAYPLRNIKIHWWYILIFIGLYALSSSIQIGNIVEISELLFHDRFGNYGTRYESSQNNSALIVQIIMYLICISKIKPLLKKSPSNSSLFALVSIGLLFQSLAGLLAEMSRISFYYCVFFMILLPRALKEYNKEYRWIINLTFIIGCLVLLLTVSESNLPIYKFA